MQKKIICFGVREYEKPYFADLGDKYGYELVLKPELLTNDNVEVAQGFEAIMLRANCNLNKSSLLKLKESGLKIVLTRTVGFAHVNVDDCKELGLEYCYVPGYSPNAISELTVTLGMMCVRNTVQMVNNASRGDFVVHDEYFSREVRGMTVGILGCGRIG